MRTRVSELTHPLILLRVLLNSIFFIFQRLFNDLFFNFAAKFSDSEFNKDLNTNQKVVEMPRDQFQRSSDKYVAKGWDQTRSSTNVMNQTGSSTEYPK